MWMFNIWDSADELQMVIFAIRMCIFYKVFYSYKGQRVIDLLLLSFVAPQTW